jgi:hypothetical protein
MFIAQAMAKVFVCRARARANQVELALESAPVKPALLRKARPPMRLVLRSHPVVNPAEPERDL